MWSTRAFRKKTGEGGIALSDAGACLLDYWSRDLPGRPGSLKEAMTVLMPPDLQEYREFVEFRDHPALDKPPSRLYEQIRTRLSWQAASEFGLMQTHGRTMEPNGSSCLDWDEKNVAATLDALFERLPGVNPEFSRVRPEQWRTWLYGILHRYREKGALSHPYLVPYAKMGFWGKYPFGRAVEGRETFPPAIRYKPKLMTTAPQRGHEHVLGHTRGGQSPWHVVWTYRALGEPPVAEADVLDLIRELLACGAAAGLLEKLHQDGDKSYFAISSSAARLLPGGVRLVCDETGRGIVRPEKEAGYWKNAPSMEYYAKSGRYRIQEYDARQRYYQDRYRKGALRRVAAREHTGLLATEERERVENRFKKRLHEDDPNVLTCTSTHSRDGNRHRGLVFHHALLHPPGHGELSATNRPRRASHRDRADRVRGQPGSPRPVLLRPSRRNAEGQGGPAWMLAGRLRRAGSPIPGFLLRHGHAGGQADGNPPHRPAAGGGHEKS